MPKRKPFVCKHCKRTFSMAAHLARHSRVHAPKRSKSAPKAAARSVRSQPAVGVDFGHVIFSLRASHRALTVERDALDAQIAALESGLAALGTGAAPKTGARVARTSSEYRSGSLKDRIQRVLSGNRAPMRVTEITAAVVRSGFKSKNKTLATSVGIALAEMSGVRRIGRGVYDLR